MSGSSDGMDGGPEVLAPNFMARLRAAEDRARRRPAPWDQTLIEMANLREDMRELKQRLQSIEEGIERIARCGRPPNSSDDD